MPDELLSPLFNNLGPHQRSEGGHDAEYEMGATSVGSAEEEEKEKISNDKTSNQSNKHINHT